MPPSSITHSEAESVGRVLIVDDNLDLGDLYAAMLRWAHIGVEVAHNADDAWTAATTREPDLILLDIDLGVTNGLDLLDRLRAHAWQGPMPKMAVFTNSSDQQFRGRAAALGADAYWEKADYRLAEFVAAVQDLCGAPCACRDAPSRRRSASPGE